ncbi:DUF6571 family protein [Streptomyces sp. ALI-76-A]|jgi:hypothetical protein|uniref:DUF6571 family protein n=1 Tax=Streptomyces sp. ALI-76-A TaxID=3025736 RepID=UPI00256EA01D|nr:DUF6571 family protein [Streptomyces sp. ALI-76-A]MDL5204131.1 hypothetical protein [Streptomyces sp. ALI-76-A]
MRLDTLLHANFTLLDDAVTDWSTLVNHLEGLKKDAEEGLHQAADKADWAGLNAQVSKEFIGKTAGEFSDAHTQAKTIHSILSDTRTELKGHHRRLVDAIDGGRKKNLKVIAYEGGFTVTTDLPPEGRADADTDNKGDITALRDELQRILDQASESDNSAKSVLQSIADQSKLGFSDADYADRDSAAAAVKKADELAKLVRKDPEGLTVADFKRLNTGLKEYANDELFAERFATVLGPEKTLEFWTGISDPGRGNHELAHACLDQFDDLQRNLGLTLAHATQSDSAAMGGWKRQMIDIGDKPIYGNSGGPMGFQVMSNLMRTGDYDDRFLKDYGTRLMETERKLTGNGAHGNGVWQRTGGSAWLNRIGEDSGSDPLTGYLKGLSNSPDAATDFFNQRYVSKDDPDNPFEWDSDDEDEYKAKKELSNFQYLFEERDWPQETDSKGDDLHTGKNNLALALEAAVTGHPAGERPTMDTPAHNEGQTKLFESLVSSISEDTTRLTDNTFMSDSIGQIAAEYLPDIDRAASDVDPHPDNNDEDARESWERIQNLYPVAESSAEMNHRDVSRFLFAVGQNPEGYSAVEVGQKKYMCYLMEYHLNPDLPEGCRPHHDLELTIRNIARHSGEVSGTLAMGRNEAVAGPSDLKDKEYDHAVSQLKNVISGTVGTGVGVGTSFVASPVVGAGVGGAAGTATSVVLEELFKDAEGSAKDAAGPKIGEDWENGQDNNMKYTRRAASEAARAHGLEHPSDVGTWAETESSRGFLDAGEWMDRVGAELVTDR